MAKADTYIGPIRGRVGNIIFRQLPGGNIIISAAPRKSKKLPTRAQVRQRAKMLNAMNFAKQNETLLETINGRVVPIQEFVQWQGNTQSPAWYKSVLPTVFAPHVSQKVLPLESSWDGEQYHLDIVNIVSEKNIEKIIEVKTAEVVINDLYQIENPISWDLVDSLPSTTNNDFIVITDDQSIYATSFEKLSFDEETASIIIDSWPQREKIENFLAPNLENG